MINVDCSNGAPTFESSIITVCQYGNPNFDLLFANSGNALLTPEIITAPSIGTLLVKKQFSSPPWLKYNNFDDELVDIKGYHDTMTLSFDGFGSIPIEMDVNSACFKLCARSNLYKIDPLSIKQFTLPSYEHLTTKIRLVENSSNAELYLDEAKVPLNTEISKEDFDKLYIVIKNNELPYFYVTFEAFNGSYWVTGRYNEYEKFYINGKTCLASSDDKNFVITAINGDNGTISPKGDIIIQNGADADFSITPDEGYSIKSLIVDGENKGALSSYSFKNVKDNHSIIAQFKKNGIVSEKSDLQLISPNGGEVLTTGTHAEIHWIGNNIESNLKIELYKDGLFSRIITYSTENDGVFDWFIKDNMPIGNNYCIKISTTSGTYSDFSNFDFSIVHNDLIKLTMSVFPKNSGVVTPNVGSHVIPAGKSLNISTVPKSGYYFVRWEILSSALNDVINNSTLQETSIQPISSLAIRAVFAKKSTIINDDFGKITMKLNGTDGGDSITVSKAPIPSVYSALIINPQDYSITLSLDNYKLFLNEATGELTKKETPHGTIYSYIEKSDDKKIKLILAFNSSNPENSFWSLSIKDTNLLSLIDISDGVDLYIAVNNALWGSNLNPIVKLSWNFKQNSELLNFSELLTPNIAMKNFNIYKAKFNNKTNGSFSISKGSIPTLNFNINSMPVVLSVDNWIFKFNDLNSWRPVSDKKYIYKTKLENSVISLILDFDKQIWKFKINNTNFENKINISDGVDVKLKIGNYEGALRLFGKIKQTMQVK